MANPNLPVHKRVRDIAIGITEELFESLMRKPGWYSAQKKLCPDLTEASLRKMFVAKAWPTFIDAARDTLVEMLKSPKYSDKQKADIHETLVLDSSLGRGKMVVDIPHITLN